MKLIGAQSKDVAQMQANTYSELSRVKEDLKALLEPQDAVGEARRERFLKAVAEHLYVINAERDEVVDVGPNGEKNYQRSNAKTERAAIDRRASPRHPSL